MLSYMKDDQNRIPAVAETEATGADAPLSRQEDYLTVSGHSQKLRQSTLLLIVLFGVGALGVWFMIKKTTPAKAQAAATEEQAQIEAAIAQLNGMQSEMNTQMDSVVGRFYQFSNIGQVSVDELKKNPFKRELSPGQAEMDLKDQLRSKQAMRQEQVRRMAAELKLWSITSTPRGLCCMINDKVLYVNDRINELTVTHIGDKTVALEYDGISAELKMDE